MKHTMLLLVTLVATSAFGKDPRGPQGGPAYNPATLISFSGTVTDVRNVPAGTLPGWHLTVKSEAFTVDVYEAPDTFLKMLHTTFAKGDHVRVTGSKVPFNDADVILTRQIIRNKVETLDLRDADGAPVWEYWGVEIG